MKCSHSLLELCFMKKHLTMNGHEEKYDLYKNKYGLNDNFNHSATILNHTPYIQTYHSHTITVSLSNYTHTIIVL